MTKHLERGILDVPGTYTRGFELLPKRDEVVDHAPGPLPEARLRLIPGLSHACETDRLDVDATLHDVTSVTNEALRRSTLALRVDLNHRSRFLARRHVNPACAASNSARRETSNIGRAWM